MAKRTTLDAMIPREDFAKQGEGFALDLLPGLPISSLVKDNAILKLLRKPDFQRETNHWTPEQVVTFIGSFVDNEVIPSLIFWRSPVFIFVIDGGHRLSALRAWMEDDYGDRAISQEFYKGEISEEQKKIAKQTRKLIESKIGTFQSLQTLVGTKNATEEQKKRSQVLFTRALPIQWIQGSANYAETSFFKINSQGTALDETEELLIRNRKRSIPISARAILRAGTGHEYWSSFAEEKKVKIKELASNFHSLMFVPEINQPIKTLDLPLGGSVSPVDALSLLIEFLSIAGTADGKSRKISDYPEDITGDGTIDILRRALDIVEHITGNNPKSLGLHPAIYFYNERGKYSRFLFLGICLLFTERIRNNDRSFFVKFTQQREKLECFLIENRSLIGILLQNMSKAQRIPKMRDLMLYLIIEYHEGRSVNAEAMIKHLGLRGRIIDVVNVQTSSEFSDETKSMVFIKNAIDKALICPICKGRIDPAKSVQYDHRVRKQDGGLGDHDNCDLVHPYCNTGFKESNHIKSN